VVVGADWRVMTKGQIAEQGQKEDCRAIARNDRLLLAMTKKQIAALCSQ